MTIEDSILYLRKQFPKISPRATYDTDSRGEDFCEIFLQNDKNLSLPISIKINAEGCFLSVGRMLNVMGSKPISVEVCASAIRDVVEDRIIFVFGYKTEEDFENSKATFHRFFALTGREDDMSEEYEKFLLHLSKKPSWFEKKFGGMTGIFEILSFNQTEPKFIKRF